MKKAGFRNDQGKPRIDLLPPEALFAMADVLTQACESGDYPERNWEKGMAWGRVYGSLMRHLLYFWAGQDYDSKSGKPHTAHILANAAFLHTYFARGIGTDTRNKTYRDTRTNGVQHKRVRSVRGRR